MTNAYRAHCQKHGDHHEAVEFENDPELKKGYFGRSVWAEEFPKYTPDNALHFAMVIQVFISARMNRMASPITTHLHRNSSSQIVATELSR
jgi:hypothetical protein